ncbi:Polysialic acid transport protein KpsD [Burkholderiaceae bacterium]|nr:Polysialic acid transport protein KpsD [Burkholderiaceae bacterium]
MRPLHFLLALSLASGPALAQSPLDNTAPSGGTFVTPGYQPPSSVQRPGMPRPGTQPSGQPGQAAPDAGPSLRSPQDGGMRPGEDVDREQRRVQFPPPRPSEFQKFVETATGRLLPVFGANFFADAAATAQGPLDNVPVSSDYVVGPGDELVIRAWGSIDVDYRATVDRNGQINLPKVGSFNVAGIKASDIERHLRAQIGRVFTNFSLNVTLGHLRGLKVFVVGPAQRPGVYTLPSQSTILSAVVAAGGPGPNGSMRKLSLRRDGKVISELDVYEFLVQGDKSKDLQLAAGDVLVFQPVGARVALTGALENPAIYELKEPQEPLSELLRYAGGAPVLASQHRGQLERIDPTQPKAARVVEGFKLDPAGLQKPVRDGDIVTLLAISPQFANAVTLKGHVAQPLRYPHTPGMRISDLIPDRDALISPDFYRRKNLLVQVIEDEDESADSRDSREARDPRGSREARESNAASNRDFSRDDFASGVADGASSRRARRSSEQQEDRMAAERAKKAPAALFEELNWDYAVVERLNMKDLSTQVIPFNLGRAVLQRDPVHNVELLPGDVVTVYSQKDIRVPVARQTRLVSLEGEVAAPGVYQLLPGETLKGLIDRAGGFTAQAYVYGLEFSREETRQRQRENLNAAMTRLQALSATQTARDAANRRDDVSADRSAAVSNAATQAQLARLAQLQPNGRIALELDPDARSADSLPDVPMEHGDRVTVPARPGFVTVAGAVVNNNAFLWKPGRTAGDYVRLAGLDEAADMSNMFVLRADGTVTSANERRGFFGYGGVQSQELQPGDAVVVPNQLDYETWGRALVRNLKDWSQIFSQFGLGAAAIQTLRNN